jgi:hypothetical protein
MPMPQLFPAPGPLPAGPSVEPITRSAEPVTGSQRHPSALTSITASLIALSLILAVSKPVQAQSFQKPQPVPSKGVELSKPRSWAPARTDSLTCEPQSGSCPDQEDPSHGADSLPDAPGLSPRARTAVPPSRAPTLVVTPRAPTLVETQRARMLVEPSCVPRRALTPPPPDASDVLPDSTPVPPRDRESQQEG